MNRHSTSGLAAVGLVTFGSLLLGGCDSSDTAEAAPRDTTSSPSTTADPPESQTSGDEGTAVPQHLVESPTPTPLMPGIYQFSVLTNPGVEAPDAVVDVPRGYDDGAAWYVVSPDSDAFFGLWTIGRVERDACYRPLHDFVTPGPSVEDLADALVAQKSTRTSVPAPVSIAGYRGLYVELAGPHDISTCDQPGLWGRPGGRGIYSDDQVDRLWILDVDGQRLVVDAANGPTATASEIHSLTSMASSLEFVASVQE